MSFVPKDLMAEEFPAENPPEEKTTETSAEEAPTSTKFASAFEITDGVKGPSADNV